MASVNLKKENEKLEVYLNVGLQDGKYEVDTSAASSEVYKVVKGDAEHVNDDYNDQNSNNTFPYNMVSEGLW
jgi:hypothetical protein